MKNNSGQIKKKLFIIDGSSVIYRAFHAVPPSFITSAGLPTNAVYGFTQSLRKIINDFAPEYIAIAFDVKGPSFRREMFDEYKANRPPMPDLLSVQIPYIKRIVRAFNIPVLEMEAFEADDVIATLVGKVEGEGVRVSVITGDKDMYQLVGDNVVILDYLNNKEYGPAEVAEKFGVGPHQIRDLIGLAGDSSDNIPGVPGVGVKTAARLLNQFKDLEDIYANIGSVKGDKLREKLIENREKAFLSRELATLHPRVPLDCSIEGFAATEPDFDALRPLLSELEFRKILTEMLPERPASPASEDKGTFEAVATVEELASLASSLKTAQRASVLAIMSDDAFGGGLLALAIATEHEKGFYIPVSEAKGDGAAEPSEEGSVHEKGFYIPVSDANGNGAADGAAIATEHEKGFYIPVSEGGDKEALAVPVVLASLKGFFEDHTIRKDTNNSKALYLCLAARGVELGGVGVDTSLASYVLNPSKAEHTVEALAYEYLGEVPQVEPKGGFTSADAAVIYGRKACNILKIAEILEKEIEEAGLFGLYAGMELPLAGVLAGMERAGIGVDGGLLSGLSKEMAIAIADIERRIYAAAGEEFNIGSPKQLSELLFVKLGLKPVKKTKTGFSTDEEVLTKLAAEHEVPRLIISYRQLAKLKSTYVDAIIELINPDTGRLHTSFNQTVTATGRLSSSRPNLQNIPVRGEFAPRIREAFVASKGFRFLSADYSQIELRLVAHMSADPVLVESFTRGEDVHSRTASEVFGIMPALVTPEMRRRAKAINFGIIYGMGAYGLASELGVSMKEAQDYINSYFAHYSRVKEFIDATVDEALERGYTVTLFGRRRFIPELKSPVESTMRLGQRLAINTPIQGTAADMIKAAMIRVSERLNQGGYASRMLLQIHDELLLEAAEGELGAVTALLKEAMEGVLRLSVPVVVNIKSGATWDRVEAEG